MLELAVESEITVDEKGSERKKRLDHLQLHFLKYHRENLTFSLIHKLNRFLILQNICFSEHM